jgi:hypothetical protein
MSYLTESNKVDVIRPGEYSWEVMEHSINVGEKPIRLVIGPDSIRTVTSLLLKRPTEPKEHWKVSSNRILKVSWCLELCVFSVLYSKPDDPKEYTKAFFVDKKMGKKIVKRYKKMKPVHVHLSPGNIKKTKKKGYHVEGKPQNPITLRSSFTLRMSEPDEKLWRATLFDSDSGEVREIFLGISPSVVRVVEPSTLECEWSVDHLHLHGIKYLTRFPNNNILSLKYYVDNYGKHPKSLSRHFHVLPLTAKEILHYFEQCNMLSLGAEAKCAFAPPSFISLPDIGHVCPGTDEVPFSRSQSVPETNIDPSQIRNQTLKKPNTGTTGTVSGGDSSGRNLSKRARPNSVKLPTRTLVEMKDEPPRSSSAKRARPKSISGGLPSPISSEENANIENIAPYPVDLLATRRTKPGGGMKDGAASAPPLHRQPLCAQEPNLPQDHKGDLGRRHSRQKSNHVGAIPIRDSVCYYGKEGGTFKRLVKEAWEGPRVAYE